MQLQSDPFLGWTTLEGRDYLVRQLNDHKASIQVEKMKDADLQEYAAVCGELLARGHARSGDCLELAGYLGTSSRFDDAIVQFAEAYADQTERDWKELVGRMKQMHLKAAPAAKSKTRVMANSPTIRPLRIRRGPASTVYVAPHSFTEDKKFDLDTLIAGVNPKRTPVDSAMPVEKTSTRQSI